MSRWELTLRIDPASRVPLFLQIARTVATDVRRGRLRPGAALPGTRTLADTLGIHRNTVYAAYADLAAGGWIATTRAGTFISETIPEPTPRRFADASAKGKWNHIGFALEPTPVATPSPPLPKKITRWDWGIPDVRIAPVRELGRAYRRALMHDGNRVLQYERYAPLEHSRLQSALAHMLSSTRGLAISPADLLVTRGSQMGLYLTARALLRPGDVVVVEHPGHDESWEVFRACGARVVPIPVDNDGVRVDALRDVLARESIRALLLTPHHQFPTTATLSIGRRLELIELARDGRFAIIEDDYDHEFHYDGRPIMPMASAQTEGVVVYIGSLSKIFAPGLRIGYVVAPRPLLDRMVALRSVIDIQGDQATELAVAELFEDGEVQRHLGRSRRIYRARRDFLADRLARELNGVLDFTVPSGGMAIWARVDPKIDVEAWAAAARARGLAFRTGSKFFLRPSRDAFVRLGFARFDERELQTALTQMVKALPKRANCS